MKKSRNLSLVQMYSEEMAKPTPAKEFLNEICRITNRSEITVRLWGSGKVQPEPLVQKVLGEALNIAPDVLFPKVSK